MSDERTRFRAALETVGAVVAILAVVVPAGIWVASHFGGKSATPSPVQSTAAGVLRDDAPSTGGGPANGPAGTTVFLDAVKPDTGATNLGALPRALDGQPGYEHAVVIACGSNSGSDTHRAVTYLLSRRYLQLKATVHVYKATADETDVQVKVFADNRDAEKVTVQVGGSGDLSIDLADVNKVTLDVVCERPGATAVLAGAALLHV